MYIPKFNYVSLPRQTIDGKRKYSVPGGDHLPSVTTILSDTKPQEQRVALQQWRARVGEEKAQQITTEAANRGTKMHTYLEGFVKQGSLVEKPQNPFHSASWYMADSVVRQGLDKCNEYWGVEVPLYFPGVYAGTTDCVGVHDGQSSIIDFKQTNKPKKREWIDDYFIQLCAYAEAHNEVHGTKINKGVIMMCVQPQLNKLGAIETLPVYQEFILQGDEFEHYRTLWWKRVEEYFLKQ